MQSCSLYHEVPAWIITTRKLVVIALFFDDIFPLCKNIDHIKQYCPKEIFLLAMSDKEYALAGIILLLCKKISGIIFHNARMFANKNPLDYNIYILQEKDIHKKISCVILNCFGSSSRRFLTFNTAMTYYFIYGEKKVQSNTCHENPPFFIWFYPHAGTGRVLPVFEFVMNFLGINHNKGLFTYYDQFFKVSTTTECTEENFRNNTDSVIKLFHILQKHTAIMLHNSVYNAEEILTTAHAKMILLTRDMRDMVVSNVNWFYGAKIKFGEEDFESLALDFMKSKQAYPSAGYFNYSGGLDFVTKELTKIVHNENVYRLKFEDVHEHGLTAYMNLFKKFGFTEDPYWVDELIIPKLKEQIFKANPHNHAPIEQNDTEHSLQIAKPGGWKKYFTPAMKEYFKQHDSNILELFGYEDNKDW